MLRILVAVRQGALTKIGPIAEERTGVEFIQRDCAGFAHQQDGRAMSTNLIDASAVAESNSQSFGVRPAGHSWSTRPGLTFNNESNQVGCRLHLLEVLSHIEWRSTIVCWLVCHLRGVNCCRRLREYTSVDVRLTFEHVNCLAKFAA